RPQGRGDDHHDRSRAVPAAGGRESRHAQTGLVRGTGMMVRSPSPDALTRRAFATGLLALAATAPAALAQISLTDPSIVETVRAMKPGACIWAPQVAPEGPVIVLVSLSEQRAFVYRNGLPIGISTISSGKEGHETPTGVFTILQKQV